MKVTPILTTLLFFTFFSFSQTIDRQLISVSGATTEGTNITLDWVMGESFNVLIETENIVMKEGFLQPEIYLEDYESQLSIDLDDGQSENFSAFIYPNPFDAQFTFQLLEINEEDLHLSLLDYTGKLVASKKLLAGSEQIEWNMDHQSAGLYFLQVSGDTEAGYQIYKVLKHY